MTERRTREDWAMTEEQLADWLLEQATPQPKPAGEHYTELEDDCLICHFKPDKGGYSRVGLRNRCYLAHRFMAAVKHANGWDSIKGQIVRHRCDVRMCINPNHLLIGTHQENMTDMSLRTIKHQTSKPRKPRVENVGVCIPIEASWSTITKRRRELLKQQIGQIPPGCNIKMTCRNAKCINPKHMYIPSLRHH